MFKTHLYIYSSIITVLFFSFQREHLELDLKNPKILKNPHLRNYFNLKTKQITISKPAYWLKKSKNEKVQ